MRRSAPDASERFRLRSLERINRTLLSGKTYVIRKSLVGSELERESPER
jgi:hypothetical protein